MVVKTIACLLNKEKEYRIINSWHSAKRTRVDNHLTAEQHKQIYTIILCEETIVNKF